MIAFPLWAVCAFAAALTMSAVPLIQEKFKADGFALSVWVKVFLSLASVPLVIRAGIPVDPLFYGYIALTSIIYAVSDVIYYNAVPRIGSGLMTRLLPAAVTLTFFIWLAIDDELRKHYLSEPRKTIAILAILAAFTFFVYRLRRCEFSWQGVRMIWPVIAAAVVGPILSKLGLARAGLDQAVPAYMLVQGVMMIMCWGVYYAVKKPVPMTTMISRQSITTGALLGLVSTLMLFFKMKAVQLVDNPAYVSLVLTSDALFVLLVYRLIGRREQSNIWAGLGIVACAMMVVLVKSWQ